MGPEQIAPVRVSAFAPETEPMFPADYYAYPMNPMNPYSWELPIKHSLSQFSLLWELGFIRFMGYLGDSRSSPPRDRWPRDRRARPRHDHQRTTTRAGLTLVRPPSTRGTPYVGPPRTTGVLVDQRGSTASEATRGLRPWRSRHSTWLAASSVPPAWPRSELPWLGRSSHYANSFRRLIGEHPLGG
jgi:hypothetical protein